ncbi:hypothetical protein [Citrobacter phage Tr1]|nr:hypothetical protein [Citrobacter phage Tr1]
MINSWLLIVYSNESHGERTCFFGEEHLRCLS